MGIREEALQLARWIRLCPPPELATLKEHTEAYRRHRNICSLCAGAVEGEALFKEVALSLSGQIQNKLKTRERKKVRAGQVWTIRHELARWHGTNYYSPPIVIITGVTSNDAPKTFQVVQIYTDLVLAGPGDLILEGKQTGGLPPFFVETWNKYTLRTEYLGVLLAQLKKEVMDAILSLSQNPEDYPEWALMPFPLQGQNDPRLQFRKIEEEVGKFFSGVGQSRNILLIKEAPRLKYKSADQLINDLSRFRIKTPSFDLKDLPPSKIIEMVKPDDAALPLAAAPEEAEGKIIALVFILKKGRIIGSKPIFLEIVDKVVMGGYLNLVGRIIDPLPDLKAEWNWSFRWVLPDGTTLEPVLDKSGVEEGRFYLAFELSDPSVAETGALNVRVYAEEK